MSWDTTYLLWIACRCNHGYYLLSITCYFSLHECRQLCTVNSLKRSTKTSLHFAFICKTMFEHYSWHVISFFLSYNEKRISHNFISFFFPWCLTLILFCDCNFLSTFKSESRLNSFRTAELMCSFLYVWLNSECNVHQWWLLFSLVLIYCLSLSWKVLYRIICIVSITLSVFRGGRSLPWLYYKKWPLMCCTRVRKLGTVLIHPRGFLCACMSGMLYKEQAFNRV